LPGWRRTYVKAALGAGSMAAKKRSLTAEEAEKWQRDREDPDNWFSIPEFGIKPVDVEFAGFKFPIVTTGQFAEPAQEDIRELVRITRSLAQREFDSLVRLRATRAEALDILILGDTDRSMDKFPSFSKAHLSAMSYFLILDDLKYAVRRIDPLGRPSTRIRSLGALSAAAVLIAKWALGDPSDLHDKARMLAKEFISRANRRAAHIGHSGSPKRVVRDFVFDCWKAWHRNPSQYKHATDFARDMQDKHPEMLKSEAVIIRWVRGWKRELD
jgi:hypothetical protein